jgi:hypothetical protein
MHAPGSARTEQDSQSSSTPAPSVTLPVAALASVLLCIPVGIVLAIPSYVRHRSHRGTAARSISIAALALAVVYVVAFVAFIVGLPVLRAHNQCLAWQAEARGNLKSLHDSEQAHRAARQTYSTDVKVLGFTPLGVVRRYEYRVLTAGTGSFLAEAFGTGEMTGDRWTINDRRELVHVTNHCP